MRTPPRQKTRECSLSTKAVRSLFDAPKGSLLIAPSRVPMPPLDSVHLGSSCAQAQARGRLPPLQSSPPSPVRTLVREFLRQQDLSRLRRRDTCKQRWLYYRGDENYGLGNVLYDVASAAAIAMVLNRSIVYGANASDRKFGSLLRWPGIPTLQDVEAARRWARCGRGGQTRRTRGACSAAPRQRRSLDTLGRSKGVCTHGRRHLPHRSRASWRILAKAFISISHSIRSHRK